jgi:hypothetical protein
MDLIRRVYMSRFRVENVFDEFIRQATCFYERGFFQMGMDI